MQFHFVRKGFSTETIGTKHECEIILKRVFQDSDISASNNEPVVFEGKPMPTGNKAVTFQSRTLDEITYVANDCFVGRAETYGLSHVYADRVVVEEEMQSIIDRLGARLKLPYFYKGEFSALAQINEHLFMPVGNDSVVLDKQTGAVLQASNKPTLMMS